MTGRFLIANGEASLTKDGTKIWSTAFDHMVVLNKVVGKISEPQRSGSAAPAVLKNVNVDQTINIAQCHARATHLIGSIVLTLGAGEHYDPGIPPSKHYTYMGGTFEYAHSRRWFAGYTFFIQNGVVKYHRRIVSAYEKTSPTASIRLINFNIRAFTLAYNLRAVCFK